VNCIGFVSISADRMKLEEVNVVVNVLHNLAKQLANMEQKLDIKVDCTKVDTLETIVNGLNNSYAWWVTKSLDETKTDFTQL